jgi:hypothetical protein
MNSGTEKHMAKRVNDINTISRPDAGKHPWDSPGTEEMFGDWLENCRSERILHLSRSFLRSLRVHEQPDIPASAGRLTLKKCVAKICTWGLISILVLSGSSSALQAQFRVNFLPIFTRLTRLVSVSDSPVLSANGRFVAFSSAASDLVAHDTNGMLDIFVRDLHSGTTTLASVNRFGTNSGNGDSGPSTISADGEFVAFTSNASDLVPTDSNASSDAFVRPVVTSTIILKPPITLWPPNHKYVTVTTDQMVAGVRGDFGPISFNEVVIEKVTSDEPEDVTGGADGATLNDILFPAGCRLVQLRSERDESGNGRVYSITLRVRDNFGAISRAVFKVTVTRSRNGVPAIEDSEELKVLSLCN